MMDKSYDEQETKRIADVVIDRITSSANEPQWTPKSGRPITRPKPFGANREARRWAKRQKR
jgi:hypothetical protein